MANQEQLTFDVEFALNQFSGNRILLVKMLDRFSEQQASFGDKLQTYVSNQDNTSAKQGVHGLKGVSGNLGMNALHQACCEFEDVLRHQTMTPEDGAKLIEVINATLQQVRQFTHGNKESSAESDIAQTAPLDADRSARQNLLKSLKRNEFISNNKLTSLTNELSMQAETLQQLLVSIDELDYEKAISLLE